jgi:hypothetical protein
LVFTPDVLKPEGELKELEEGKDIDKENRVGRNENCYNVRVERATNKGTVRVRKGKSRHVIPLKNFFERHR